MAAHYQRHLHSGQRQHQQLHVVLLVQRMLLLVMLSSSTSSTATTATTATTTSVSPLPFRVGEIQPFVLPWLNLDLDLDLNGTTATFTASSTTTSTKVATQTRLPWAVTAMLRDYCGEMGIPIFLYRQFQQQNMDPEDYPPKPTTSKHTTMVEHTTNDGALWHMTPISTTSSTSSTNMHYLETANRASQDQLISILARTEFDVTLQAIGDYYQLEQMDIVSIGFVAATYSYSYPWHTSDSWSCSSSSNTSATTTAFATTTTTPEGDTTTNASANVFQVLIPLYLKKGSRPEWQVVQHPHPQERILVPTRPNVVPIKHENNIALVFPIPTVLHDTHTCTCTITPGAFDYRDSPGAIYLALAMTIVADVHPANVDRVHDMILQPPLRDQDTTQPQSQPHLPIPIQILPLPPLTSRESLLQHYANGQHWMQQQQQQQHNNRLLAYAKDLYHQQQEQQQQILVQYRELCRSTGQDEYCKNIHYHDNENDNENEHDTDNNNNDTEEWWTELDWTKWEFDHFKDTLQCYSIFEAAVRPVPDIDAPLWQQLRTLYTDIVGPDQSTLSVPLSSQRDGFEVNVKAVLIPGKGRGIIAQEFIPRGTLVYQSKQQARFSNPLHYKQMLMSVPVETACDLLAWISVQTIVDPVSGESLPPQIVLELDRGALVNGASRAADGDEDEDDEEEEYEESSMTRDEILNSGTTTARRQRQRHHHEDEDEHDEKDEVEAAEVEEEQEEEDDDGAVANIGCIPSLAEHVPGGCTINDFALMDIQVGDEILSDYGDFAIYDDDVWQSLGLRTSAS